MNTAMDNLVKAGVFAAVAAGNENQNACNVSPASAPLATTTGATTIKDARASFSNFGTCVDVFAPGQDITSTWIGSTTATNTISGTSMASPAVAGVAAAILSANLAWTPAQVEAELLATTTLDVVTNSGTGSPNKLLYLSC
ncbi:serine proteinase [Capsaspora owczarzaki ATCC 30864]|nr:serine proteinase [Capsaspora owczarzaki ATCC 30864]|eukprot:XP_004345746.1 serine proteinase [Capsaspora owczarzaki ATCC 30864]